jgi:redox-sensing transcriptional repressor
MKTVTHRTVGRLSLYRRILNEFAAEKEAHVYSHVLAHRAAVTAAQVRRDLMVVGYTGTPSRGYDVHKLRDHIDAFLFPVCEQRVALAGVGNIGRAVLNFFSGRRPKLSIVAAFEKNPDKYGRVIGGCPCYSIEQAGEVIREQGITIGIIAVPDEEAQYVARVFVAAGVAGLLNFARAPLHLPPDIYVEDIDLAASMDKVAYFARRSRKSVEVLEPKEITT